MHQILLKIAAYLDRANNEAVGMAPEIIDEACEALRVALHKQFNEGPREKFTLRLSNIGRPLCQLQLDKAGTPTEQHGYNHTMKMLIGDITEIAAVAVMKAAGVNVVEEQTKVTLPISDTTLNGTLDVVIDEGGKGIWDIKSASRWTFDNKFRKGYEAVKESDGFGYIAQGQTYAKASGLPFKGWIVINKETGEWCLTEAPPDPDEQKAALERAAENYESLRDGKPFEKCFEDSPETWYRKPTGRRVMPMTCTFCPFKGTCWPDARYLPNPRSKNKFKSTWYTHYVENEEDNGKKQ